MELAYYGESIQNKRTENMDSLLIKKSSSNGEALIVVVCDGVGSLPLGGYASSKAVNILKDWFEDIDDFSQIGIKLLEISKIINTFIFKELNIKKVCTATTFTVAVFYKSKMYCVHVGDSRLYVVKDGNIKQLTVDDTKNGKLSAYMGQNLELYFQYYEENIGDFILVCSDGLYKTLKSNEIYNTVKKNSLSEKEKVMRLIKLALKKGETDNITCAVIKKIKG